MADTLTMLKLNYVETSKQAKAEDKMRSSRTQKTNA